MVHPGPHRGSNSFTDEAKRGNRSLQAPAAINTNPTHGFLGTRASRFPPWELS